MRLALRVGFYRRRLAQHRAQIIEVRLRDGLLRLRDLPPLVDELGSRHPITQNNPSHHHQASTPPTFCPQPAANLVEQVHQRPNPDRSPVAPPETRSRRKSDR